MTTTRNFVLFAIILLMKLYLDKKGPMGSNAWLLVQEVVFYPRLWRGCRGRRGHSRSCCWIVAPCPLPQVVETLRTATMHVVVTVAGKVAARIHRIGNVEGLDVLGSTRGVGEEVDWNCGSKWDSALGIAVCN